MLFRSYQVGARLLGFLHLLAAGDDQHLLRRGHLDDEVLAERALRRDRDVDGTAQFGARRQQTAHATLVAGDAGVDGLIAPLGGLAGKVRVGEERAGHGDKVGVAGIGGLGHMAIKLAVSKGAEVYAFTTSPSKVNDILRFGAKEAIVVDGVGKLAPYKAKLDFMISTIPVQYDVAAYAAVVKPFGFYTQVGMPQKFELTLNNLGLSISRVNFNGSLIGDMKETQDVVNYCADNKILPQIQVITAEQINQAWENVVNKNARYRYVIDAGSF